MTPEGWALMTAVAVAVIGGTASVRAAKLARQAQIETQREAAKESPYEALAERVVRLESRIEDLETELRTEREKSAHLAAAFRTRIQVLLRHIAALDEYAQVLADIIRRHSIPVTTMPNKPELPPSPADEL